MTTMMGRLRLLPVLLAGAVFALVVAACGGTATSSAPTRQLDDLASVAKQSAQIDTARFDLRVKLTVPGAPTPLAFGADGAFDSTSQRATATIDLSSLVSMMGALGGALGGDAGAKLGAPEDWKIDVILDGKVVYVKVPPFAAGQIPGGKPWIKGDLETLAAAGGSGVDLGSFGTTDPKDLLKVLESVSGGLERVGRESVRGVDTTHYRATLDLKKVIESGAGTQAAPALGDLDKMLQQTGLSTIPLDVWVDDADLLRRMDIAVSTTQPGQGTADASITFELYDVGEPVSIELPPPDDVTDASTLRRP
jgi:hypothetical protein